MTSFTVSMLKTFEDQDFPWEITVKENGVIVFYDMHETRPSVSWVLHKMTHQTV